MKKELLYLITIILLSGLTFRSAQGQTFEEKRQQLLEKQTNTRAEINVLDARIKAYEQRVNQAENQYNELYRQFEDLTRLISLQDDKIETLEDEQDQIQQEINITEEEITLREKDLKLLIDNYKEILLYTYKNGRSSNLELLLTSGSINQMLIRSYYLQKLEEQKAKQADQIRIRQRQLQDIKVDLQQSHFRNQLVLDEIREEKLKLGNQQSAQQQSVEKLKSEFMNWQAELKKVRDQRENLLNNISSLIAEEEQLRRAENERLQRLAEARNIADAARRAEEVAKYSTPTSSTFIPNETLAVYEQNFAISKGRLPWPVNSTTVSRKFGVTRNPLYGTNTPHNGINIVTDPASPVKAVADGYVINILPITGYGNVILVKHGSYYTLYGNLSEVNVSVSTPVQAGMVIGKSGTRFSEMGETLYFMVRKNTTDLNPEDWLATD